MKINRVIYWITALVLVFITFWFGYVHKSPKEIPPEQAVPVEVEVVSTDSIEETIELTGWIKANKVVDVKSKVQGRIESLQVVLDNGGLVDLEEGLAVTKGQQLAVIDHEVYLAQVAAAEAGVKTSEVELADAERERKRIVALYEGGSATEQSRDKAVTAAELAKARLTLAKSNLKLAQINLRESTIISPIDGIVTIKHIDEGNLIRAGDSIAMVSDMKTVKVIVAVAEKYGADIAVGTPVKIKVDAFGERVFRARVYSIYPALDAETHMMQVEIRLKNDELLLKPGTFARVTLITNRKDDVVVIPRDVVLGGRIDDKPYVYIVEDEISRKRFVKLGINQADKYEITEGLEVGERFVVNGMNYLTDGMSVEVVRIEDIK
ncbi:MAG: efflux RND transporter periplasmic adaptor subunit [Planctomycetota bacterium]|jgi:RND family efflux transporter MFP subunit